MLINISTGEDMGSILLKVGFFLCQYILSKRCLLTSLNLSFSQVYQYFLISKQKKFPPHAGFEPGPLLTWSVHGTLYFIGWHPKTCCWHHKTCCYHHFCFSFTMLLLDRILKHIVNHISNTSYHLQYLYCQGGYVFGAKPKLITCVAYIFLSACCGNSCPTKE